MSKLLGPTLSPVVQVTGDNSIQLAEKSLQAAAPLVKNCHTSILSSSCSMADPTMNTALFADPNTTAESREAVSSAVNERIQQEFKALD